MVTESHRIAKMGKHTRKAYLQAIKTRYRQIDQLKKHTILDEFCGYAREYVIRLLSRQSDTPRRETGKRPGVKLQYQADTLMAPLRRIWFASNQPCGERSKAVIPLWLSYYETQ